MNSENREIEVASCKFSPDIQSFVAKGPQIFRVGDIVEAQISFIVVPLKGQNVKMLCVLHAIALLNENFTQVQLSRWQCRAMN